jgi:alkaline phosphatase
MLAGMRRVAVAIVPALVVVGACGGDGGAGPGPNDARVVDARVIDAPAGPPPAVIVMIGDGMGPGQLDSASLYRHGATGRLFLQSLPRHGEVRTGGPSGITDSAAAATVMATGVYTLNGTIGLDRHGAAVPNVVEDAAARGWATGVVTTAMVTHATPAGFTAHVPAREQYLAIADQQAMTVRPDVMLGGGARYFLPAGEGSDRGDDGLLDDLAAAGYPIAGDRAALAAASSSGATRLFGAFTPDHLTYVLDREATTTEPTLAELSAAALAVLDRDPDGFFVMIEGGRIDHASHDNDLPRAIGETLAFDDTVAQVAAWARARGNVTLLVTADHECGGLEVVTPAAAGTYPTVRWRWGNHTNARVGIWGEGPGSEAIAGALIDHRWIHAITEARLADAPLAVPPREPMPDGELADLRHRAATQANATGYGVGFNQLDALWLDTTADGLFIGVAGLFQWQHNAVEILIDVDLDVGGGSGPASLHGAVTDATGVADRVLAASSVLAPATPFGLDVVIVSLGGADPRLADLRDDGGLRGVRPPFGRPDDLAWLPAAVNFGAVRPRDEPFAPLPGQGLEAFVPMAQLYPAGLPVGAKVGVAVVLVNDDGGHTSNQALPPFPAGTANPGRTLTPLPGIAVYELDHDRDGVVDGATPPTILP